MPHYLSANQILLTLMLLLTTAAASAAEGWIQLFNGKNLDGWKVSENPASFHVADGNMVVDGRRGHAFYVGGDHGGQFKNFHLRAQVQTKPKANSGIYFHSRYREKGWPDRGYEAQVNNSHRDRKKTGGLYNVQDNYEAPVKDNEWFTYEIIVLAPHIIVKINGKTISDYTEPEDLDRPERQLSQGLIAIQAHDPKSVIWYRSIEIKMLP